MDIFYKAKMKQLSYSWMANHLGPSLTISHTSLSYAVTFVTYDIYLYVYRTHLSFYSRIHLVEEILVLVNIGGQLHKFMEG